ncbi:MAG: HNH endonuclease [Chloroflexi bacterium]|nr:HNH endonuclease [Chloroflexota bacterium]MCC6893537.1 HNH endonuclease [Anaerolineae bacterium]
MTHIPDTLRILVRQRANNNCEYCLLNERFTIKRHEIDHITAEKHGGDTIDSNLCLSCHDCNRHKGSDLTTFDPITKQLVRLFDPRNQIWIDHFELDGPITRGKSAIGRATVNLLQMNDEPRVLERLLLIAQGLYP